MPEHTCTDEMVCPHCGDGVSAKLYKLDVTVPSASFQIKASPHQPGFWLLVNGVPVPRSLVLEYAHLCFQYPESPDRRCLVGTRRQLDMLPSECFNPGTKKQPSR